MIRSKKWRSREISKALETVPRHVLQSKQRAVGIEQGIQISISNNHTIRRLDNILQYTIESRSE